MRVMGLCVVVYDGWLVCDKFDGFFLCGFEGVVGWGLDVILFGLVFGGLCVVLFVRGLVVGCVGYLGIVEEFWGGLCLVGLCCYFLWVIVFALFA